jgi:hypothetical protein
VHSLNAVIGCWFVLRCLTLHSFPGILRVILRASSSSLRMYNDLTRYFYLLFSASKVSPSASIHHDSALSGPRGASSQAGPGRPSSRGTSTAPVSARVQFSDPCTYEKPHGCAKTGGHEPVEWSNVGDLDGVVWHLSVFGRTHPAKCGLHGCV